MNSSYKEACWFCKSGSAGGLHLIFPMFRLQTPDTGNGSLWTDTHIKIPRCQQCKIEHMVIKYSRIFAGALLAIAGYIFLSTGGFVLGLVIGVLMGSFLRTHFLSKIHENILSFNLVQMRISQGWLLNEQLPQNVSYYSYDHGIMPLDRNRDSKQNKLNWVSFV